MTSTDTTTTRDGKAGSPCPVCGASAHRPFAEKDGYAFQRCGECRFVFLDPMPADDELAAIYNSGSEAPSCFTKHASRVRRAHLKLPRFFRYIVGKDVLDLGCGGGIMVAALGRVARRAVGLDISAQAIELARSTYPKHTFIAEHFRDASLNADSFDFVHASEIIEHVNDLDAFMSLLRNITRTGGHVYITTPDIGHSRVPPEVRDWDVFSPPRHLQFFERSTLTRVFAKYGFEARRKYFDAKPGLQMLFRKAVSG